MFFGPQKYNHRQLVKDLRAGDEDLCIFTLRTVIKLEKGNLKNIEAIGELRSAIEGAQEGWSTETRFYATRALEHLGALEKSFLSPHGDEDEDLSKAEIDVDELGVDDPEVVVRCLRAIEIQKETSATDEVARLLKTASDPAVLVAALGALGAIGEQTRLFELKKFNDNPNRRVRATYVDTIAALASERTVGAMMVEPFLKDADGAVRARAIAYLGVEDFEKVRGAIEKTVASKEVADRAALAAALTSITNDEVVAYVRQLAEDDEEMVRLKLLESFDRSDHPQKTFLIKKLSKDPAKPVRRIALEAQSRLDTERLLAMGGFQQPEGRANIPTVEETLAAEELDPIDLDDLKAEAPAVVLQCLHKIRERTHEKAHQPVFDLLGTTENEEILATTLRCLTVIGAARDTEAVMHFLTHGAPRVRSAAAEAMSQLGTKTQILFLLLPMVHDAALEVQGVAARAVLRYEQAEVMQALGAMTTHQAVPIRIRTVHFLANYAGEAVQKTLARMARDQAPQVRHAVATRSLPLEPWADQVLAELSKDPVEDIANAARYLISARQRHREDGRSYPQLPSLERLFEVARGIEEDWKVRRKELDAEEEARRKEVEDAARAAAQTGKGAVEALAKKVGDDLTARREREMVYLARDNILAAMGKKLHMLIKAKAIQHAKYEKPVYLVDKYLHLAKQVGGKKEAGGFWGALKKAAGVEEEDDRKLRNDEKVRQAYIDLGKVCRDLSYQEGVIHPQLDIDYVELDAAEKRVEAMEGV